MTCILVDMHLYTVCHVRIMFFINYRDNKTVIYVYLSINVQARKHHDGYNYIAHHEHDYAIVAQKLYSKIFSLQYVYLLPWSRSVKSPHSLSQEFATV